jgi:PAS domain S-box-containing protein
MGGGTLFNISPEDFVIWGADRSGNVVADNPSWQDFTGQSLEESRDCGRLNAIHPDDRERTIVSWREALANHSNYQSEYRLLRHDGVYRHVLSRGIPVCD